MRVLKYLLGLGVAGGVVFAGVDAVVVSEVERLETIQSAAVALQGKYERVAPTVTGNITRRVDEQQYPDGSVGYVIYETRMNKDGSRDARKISHTKEVTSSGWERVYTKWVSATSTP